MVFGVSVWCSVRRDFGDGCAGCGFVDDGLVGGERGDEGLECEVVDRARGSRGWSGERGDGVVGEQPIVAAGEGEVVVEVAAGLGLALST